MLDACCVFSFSLTHSPALVPHSSAHALILSLILYFSPALALQGEGGSDLSALLGHRRAVHRLAAFLERRYVPIQTTPFLMLALKASAVVCVVLCCVVPCLFLMLALKASAVVRAVLCGAVLRPALSVFFCSLSLRASLCWC